MSCLKSGVSHAKEEGTRGEYKSVNTMQTRLKQRAGPKTQRGQSHETSRQRTQEGYTTQRLLKNTTTIIQGTRSRTGFKYSGKQVEQIKEILGTGTQVSRWGRSSNQRGGKNTGNQNQHVTQNNGLQK